MINQRLLNALALLTLLSVIAAAAYWYLAGQPPGPWLVKFAGGTFAAALIAALAGADTRPRVMFRFLSALFALLAVLALASDVARSSATGVFSPASLSQNILNLAPSLLSSLKGAAARFGPDVWDSYVSVAFNAPTFVLFGGLAFCFGFAGRRRRLVEIFVN